MSVTMAIVLRNAAEAKGLAPRVRVRVLTQITIYRIDLGGLTSCHASSIDKCYNVAITEKQTRLNLGWYEDGDEVESDNALHVHIVTPTPNVNRIYP